MPMLAAGEDAVLVGRVREDASQPRGLELFVVRRQHAQGRGHERPPDRAAARGAAPRATARARCQLWQRRARRAAKLADAQGRAGEPRTARIRAAAVAGAACLPGWRSGCRIRAHHAPRPPPRRCSRSRRSRRAQTAGVDQSRSRSTTGTANDQYINLEECDAAQHAQIELQLERRRPIAGRRSPGGVYRSGRPTRRRRRRPAVCPDRADATVDSPCGRVGGDITDARTPGRRATRDAQPTAIVARRRAAPATRRRLPIHVCVHYHPYGTVPAAIRAGGRRGRDADPAPPPRRPRRRSTACARATSALEASWTRAVRAAPIATHRRRRRAHPVPPTPRPRRGGRAARAAGSRAS